MIATGARSLGVARRALLAVLVLGIAGTLAELVLLEHTEDWKQWIPLALLGLGLLASIGSALSAQAAAAMTMRVTMLAYVVSGILGTWYHYRGNVEFELERTPELSGLALVRAALGGATPSLAPGTMVQLGLVGLVYLYVQARERQALSSPSDVRHS
jgi:hypothetical protein